MINIKDRGQIFRVDVDSIEKIDAAGDYMCIYTADNTLILRETMKDLENASIRAASSACTAPPSSISTR
jgi:DNA-binding LytR/AlgR family response regulator